MDVLALKDALEDARGSEFDVSHAETLKEAKKCLVKEDFDVLILDLGLPDSQGIETFIQIQNSDPATPIVVLSGLDDETLAIEAVGLGAQDYLRKDLLSSHLISRSLAYAIERPKMLKGILSTCPVGVSFTREREIIWANEAWVQMFGFDSDQEWRQKSTRSLYTSPDEYERIGRILDSNLRMGKITETDAGFRRKDGSEFDALLRMKPLDPGDPKKGVMSAVSDISERKRAEEELRTALERFYSILSHQHDGLLLVSEEGIIEFANQAFCDQFELSCPPSVLRGLTAQNLLKQIRHVYAEPASAQNRIREIVQQRQPVKGEEIAIRGERTYLRDFIPIEVAGKPYGRLWHHRDITYLKRAETEKAKLIADLIEALAQVKKLSGFLPICASCKNIRDDQGYWRQVEEYIREHSEAQFSHSICPECAKKLYPGLYKHVANR